MSQSNRIEKAANDLNDIAALENNASFQRYHVRRLNEKIEKLSDLILHDRDMPVEKLQEHRNALWALEEVRDMPALDRKLNENVSQEFREEQ